jgi:hypothetical protein
LVFTESSSERVVRRRWNADAAHVLGIGRPTGDRKGVDLEARPRWRGVAVGLIAACRSAGARQGSQAANKTMHEIGAKRARLLRSPDSFSAR